MANDPDQARLRRKLTSPNRLAMAHLAVEKFRRPDLRAIEVDAKQRVIDLLYRDALAVPARELKVLAKHGFTRRIEGFEGPYTLGYRTVGEDRSFKLPDGTKVDRKDKGTWVDVSSPTSDELDLPRFHSWLEARKATAERDGKSWHAPEREYVLPKPVDLPGSGTRHSAKSCEGISFDNDTHSRARFETVCSSWFTPESHEAMIAHYRAADERICAERKLIVSAIQVLAACDTYGQALDFWPEVEAVEEAMFGKREIPPAFALVALTDADKAALCANMASRGVVGGACGRMAA